jgi:hypothetical protein
MQGSKLLKEDPLIRKLCAMLLIVILGCDIGTINGLAQPGKSGQSGQNNKTDEKAQRAAMKANLLALADQYIKSYEPSLDMQARQNVEDIQGKIFTSNGVKSLQDDIVEQLVNSLTISLASLKDLKGLAGGSNFRH